MDVVYSNPAPTETAIKHKERSLATKVSGKLHSSLFSSKSKEPKSDDISSVRKNSLESPMPDDGFSTSSCAISLCDPDGLQSRSESRDSNISTRPSSTLSANKKSLSWHRRFSINLKSPTESCTVDVSHISRPTTTPTFPSNNTETVIKKHYATHTVYKPSSGITDIVEGKESQFVRSSSSATLPPNFPASTSGINPEKHKAAWKKLFGWRKKNKSKSETKPEDSKDEEHGDPDELPPQRPADQNKSIPNNVDKVENRIGNEAVRQNGSPQGDQKSSEGTTSSQGVFFDSEDEIFEPRSPDSMEEFSFKFGRNDSRIRRLKATLPADVICELKNLTPPPTQDFIPIRKQQAGSDISGDSQFVDGDTTSDDVESPVQMYPNKPHPVARARKVSDVKKTASSEKLEMEKASHESHRKSSDSRKTSIDNNKKLITYIHNPMEKKQLKLSKSQEELDTVKNPKEIVKNVARKPIQRSSSTDYTLNENCENRNYGKSDDENRKWIDEKSKNLSKKTARRSSSLDDTLEVKESTKRRADEKKIEAHLVKSTTAEKPKSKTSLVEKSSKLRFPLRTQLTQKQEHNYSTGRKPSISTTRIPTQSTASSRNKENKSTPNDGDKNSTRKSVDKKKNSIGRSGIRRTSFHRRSLGRNSNRKQKQQKQERAQDKSRNLQGSPSRNPSRNPQGCETERLDFKHVNEISPSHNRPFPSHSRSRSRDSIGSIAGFINMDPEIMKQNEELKERETPDQLDVGGTLSPLPGNVLIDGEGKAVKHKFVNQKQQRSSLVNTPSGISVMDHPQEIPHRLPLPALPQPILHEKSCEDSNRSEPNWTRTCATMLNYHKWFNPESSIQAPSTPDIKGTLLTAAGGLRLIELRDLCGNIIHHWEFPEAAPTTFQLALPEKAEKQKYTSEIVLIAIDSFGNLLYKNININSF